LPYEPEYKRSIPTKVETTAYAETFGWEYNTVVPAMRARGWRLQVVEFPILFVEACGCPSDKVPSQYYWATQKPETRNLR
jgi:hypothetical protein